MRTITFMTEKGGVGKTTLATNLAAALTLQGSKVLLVDCDPQAHSSIAFGVAALDAEKQRYWHAAQDSFGALIVVPTLAHADVLALRDVIEQRIAQRQQADVDSMIREGHDHGEAQDVIDGFPTATAICAPVDEIAADAYEAYQWAAGTFDQPLVIAVWDGSAWYFEEEVIE